MSAFGYKQTFRGLLANVRFTPKSGHWWRKNASDSKSGHWVSALHPKADVIGCGVRCLLLTHFGHVPSIDSLSDDA